ncbi:MAG: CPBP family intramembrane metalloprotease [Acidobacteria bacterium]|nr:CPBP family intramembrane metalloprotease [Acidobacteriota bacterium]
MVWVARAFVNPVEARLRAGWRLVVFILVFAATSRLVTAVAFGTVGRLQHGSLRWWVLRGVIVMIAATLSVWLVRRWVDRRSFRSLGIRVDERAWRDSVVGFAISAAMVGTVVALCAMFGFLEVDSISWKEGFGSALAALPLWFFGIGISVAWSEELGLRGYVLQNLSDGIGLVWAVLLSCVFYGAIHMANPNSTVLSGVLIGAVGYLRVLGWLRTGQLWLSMGMHAGWDFLLGPVLGLSVSGVHTEGLVHPTLSGPSWVTGGTFGPEAGVALLPALGGGLLLMHLWTAGRVGTPWTRAAETRRHRKKERQPS